MLSRETVDVNYIVLGFNPPSITFWGEDANHYTTKAANIMFVLASLTYDIEIIPNNASSLGANVGFYVKEGDKGVSGPHIV